MGSYLVWQHVQEPYLGNLPSQPLQEKSRTFLAAYLLPNPDYALEPNSLLQQVGSD
jgi:hypothetical protein